jgi:hypothetical protein
VVFSTGTHGDEGPHGNGTRKPLSRETWIERDDLQGADLQDPRPGPHEVRSTPSALFPCASKDGAHRAQMTVARMLQREDFRKRYEGEADLDHEFLVSPVPGERLRRARADDSSAART